MFTGVRVMMYMAISYGLEHELGCDFAYGLGYVLGYASGCGLGYGQDITLVR